MVDAVASFHGGLTLPALPNAGFVKGKILVAKWCDDKFISEQHISDFKAVIYLVGADSLAKKFEIPIAYNAAADSASWEEMKKLFKESF